MSQKFRAHCQTDNNWEIWTEDEDGVASNVAEFLEEDMALRMVALLNLFEGTSTNRIPKKNHYDLAIKLLSIELRKQEILMELK
jgi:hypothetical protein